MKWSWGLLAAIPLEEKTENKKCLMADVQPLYSCAALHIPMKSAHPGS